MKLLGIHHHTAHLEKIIDYISNNCKDSLESIMLELPSNWDELSSSRPQKNFFTEIADKFKKESNSSIIYGDVSFKSIPLSSFEVFKYILDEFTFKKRSKTMIKTAKIEKPSLVILGIAHATDLKNAFPEAHYVYFQTEFKDLTGRIVSKIISSILYPIYNADEIIYLEPPSNLRKPF